MPRNRGPILHVIPEADLRIDITPAGLLGTGSFSLVQRATWEGKPSAAMSLQRCASEVGDAPARAFSKEIEVLVCLRHPHIVPVYGVCHHTDGRSTLVMELATGGTLHSRLHPGEGGAGVRLPLGELASIASGIAQALTYAHASGVTHNDLKSSNVLFNSSGIALLSDFGLVKRVRAALPGTYAALLGSSSGGGGLLGTRNWTAPENFDDKSPHHCQPPGDVYSMGLLMYEMATGEEPWAGMSFAQIVGAVTGGKRPALPADTDARVRAVIEKCWAQDPAARPSAAALVGELGHLCQGEAEEPSLAAAVMQSAEAERRAEAAEAEAQAQRAGASALEAEMAALRLRAQEVEARAAEAKARAAEAEAQAQRARASALEAEIAVLGLRAQEVEARAAAAPSGPGDGTGAGGRAAAPSGPGDETGAGGGGGGASDFPLGSAAVDEPTSSMTPARIVELLRAGGRSAVIAKYACRALSNIADTPAGGEACVAAGAVPALLAALKSHPSVAAVAEYACDALREIAANNTSGKEACLAALLAALKSHPSVAAVAEYACAALSNIADIPAGGEACLAAGAVPALLAALKSHPSVAEVAKYACDALRKIAANNTSGKEACLAALLAALKSHPSVAAVAEYACAALRKIADIPAGGEACLAAGAVPALLAALKSHPSKAAVAMNACGALSSIAVIPAGGEACVAAGAVPELLAALKSHPSVAAVAKYACDALRKIVANNTSGK